MQPNSIISSRSRLGFHYFPDTLHYRERDLQIWLPELKSLQANWLTLLAPAERAIPEFFLNGLLEARIEPLLHFPLSLSTPVHPVQLTTLFHNYARWGVHYVALFDRPNTRQAWDSADWAQADLVERFLDIYLPVAEAAQREGLLSIFPPLEAGGDYWDTAFLRAALRGIQRRGYTSLLENFILGAYAWTGKRSLDWGAGGPERWPASRPYYTPPGAQDQIGFRIFDWHLPILQAELGSSRPVFLLRAGIGPGNATPPEQGLAANLYHIQRNMEIAQLISGENLFPDQGNQHEPVPSAVQACNFWLLAADENSSSVSHAWFQPDGSQLPVVNAYRQWKAGGQLVSSTTLPLMTNRPPRNQPRIMAQKNSPENGQGHPIDHYLLLPLYAWGAAEWDIEAVQPLLQKFHPTVGFSLSEASLAARVTVVGGAKTIPEEALDQLRSSGCIVERLTTVGTNLAS